MCTFVSGQAQQIFFFGVVSPAGAAACAAAGSSFFPKGHSPMVSAFISS